MVRAIIESFMGPTFVRVMRFYEANSLIINSVVLLYGLVIFLSWASLVNIRKRLIAAMVHQMQQHPDFHPKTKAKRVLREIEIPWEAVVGQMKYPFVAQQAALWPRRRTVEAVKELLPAEDLAAAALDVFKQLSGDKPTDEAEE